jgi:hypothetical protein
MLMHVMAGLVPAIHALETVAGGRGKGVDARHKAGHDERRSLDYIDFPCVVSGRTLREIQYLVLSLLSQLAKVSHNPHYGKSWKGLVKYSCAA